MRNHSSAVKKLVLPLLMLLVLPVQLSGQQGWWERAGVARTKFYNFKTDLPKEQAVEIANHMDNVYESYANLFKGLKLRRKARLDVYVFATQADYMQVLRERFKNDGSGSAGKCITRGSVISLVAWRGKNRKLDGLKRTLQHEGFHQFASNFFPNLPTWANEGLAEVFERGVMIDGKIVLGEVSRTDVIRLRSAKRQNQFRSMGDILTVKQSDWNHQVATGRSGQNYLQAWCLCHCFLYAENARYQKQFMKFLGGINAGATWEKSFVNAFGVPNFTDMDKIWLRYIDTLTPMDYKQTIRRLEFLAAGYMSLREKKIYPLDLAELEQNLVENNFEHDSDIFGTKSKMSGTTKSNYKIPFFNAWKVEPVFELVTNRGKKPVRPKEDSGKKAKRSTRPLIIQTANLAPVNFRVTWKSDRKQPGGYRPVFSTK